MNYLSKFKEGTSLALLAGLFLVLLLVIIFAPFAIIWSLNQIIPTASIPYTFYTWLSVVILKTFTVFNVRISK